METELNRDLVAQIVLMGRELDRAEGELRGVIDRLGDRRSPDIATP